MIAHQEELDWEYYRIYGLIEEDLTYSGRSSRIVLGERAFEIALARKLKSGEEETAWFSPSQLHPHHRDSRPFPGRLP